MKNKVLGSLGHALLVLVYVSIVAFIMSHANQLFGPKDTAFTPVAVLMLLVLSAAVMFLLVPARPLMMFLNGEKKEAAEFLVWTIGWLALITVIVFVVLGLMR